MNVYEKLNEARCEFLAMNVKKSGKNDYAGYSYYELSDILPVINQIGKQLKFACIVCFGSEVASLKFIDCEKPEDYIEFACPMSEANQKGCQPVQNLGSVQTYIKRYLYQNCFEIVEADVLDLTTGKEIAELIEKVKAKMSTFSEKQIEYANWCIEHKNKEGLEKILNSKKGGQNE